MQIMSFTIQHSVWFIAGPGGKVSLYCILSIILVKQRLNHIL